ncbi:MAG: zf-TFIIB domain-containing protein [Deltaproteobacteria bacterium]|nr:zf-TFIIB domain-containing protein [Deltaproteobacteria bacterium]
MARRHEHGVELDACATCGIWFDRGELEAHREQRAHNAGERRAQLHFEATLAASPGACPRCNGTALESGRAAAMVLARCPACRGIWVPIQQRADGASDGAWHWLDLLTGPLDAADAAAGLLDLLSGIDL